MEPRRKPYALEKSVVIRVYFDANYAGNMLNRRPHTGIIIYVNNAPIIWFSKRKNTVESSIFGSELIALRVTTEMMKEIRYTLRTFGIPIDELAEVLCDN